MFHTHSALALDLLPDKHANCFHPSAQKFPNHYEHNHYCNTYYDGGSIVLSTLSLDDKPAVRVLGNDALMMAVSLCLEQSTVEGSTDPSREKSFSST